MTNAGMPHLMRRLSDCLYAGVTGRRVLLTLPLYILLTIILQVINTKTKALSGGDLLSFEIAYDSTRAHHLLTLYGPEGRQLQLIAVLCDLIMYIPLYTLLFSLTITYLLTKAHHVGRLQISNLFPLLTASINVLKDLGILVLIAVYPGKIDIVGTGTGYLTLAEWISSSATLCLILLSLIVFLRHAIRYGMERSTP
jgi:hypothetical protein